MKVLFSLLLGFGMLAVSDAAAMSAAGGFITAADGVITLQMTTGDNLVADGTITVKCTTPIFLVSIAQNADKHTSGLNAAATAGTDANGWLVMTQKATTLAAGPVTIVLATGLLDTNTPAGVYSCTVVSSASTVSGAFPVPVFSAADTMALGKPSRASSSLKAAAPGAVTFQIGFQEALTASSTITLTASEAIFTASVAAHSTAITTFNIENLQGTVTDIMDVTASTISTDATGKIATITLGQAAALVSCKQVLNLVIGTTGSIFATNPAAIGLVDMEIKGSVSTTASTSTYPVFNAASTMLYMGATLGTDEISVAPASLALSFVPQTNVAADATLTFTASTALFTASQTPACAAGIKGGTMTTGFCEAASDSTGKILTVTVKLIDMIADSAYTVTISDNLATNPSAAGAANTFTLKSSADGTASAAASSPYVFAAALTGYFVSASASTLTGLAAPGNVTFQFVPQATVVGGAAAGTVILTANAAVFDASGSYPGSGCQGTDCITCTSKKNLYATTVPCTAAADSTGKVLTVTASTASTNTDSNDFTASEIGQIVLTNHMVNPNATAVTFALTTGVDTASTGAQTGYTTTSVAAAAGTAASPAGATTTGTYSTATTTVSFTGYTYVAGAAATNFANVVGCAYAKTVSDNTASLTSHMCVASSGPTFSYMTGASTTNTASAARRTGTSVAVALKVYHSLISQTAATAAVTAVGTTLTAINANLAAINLAAGTAFSTGELTATGMTAATWTHSSAAVVVPSMMAMFSALVLVLMQ